MALTQVAGGMLAGSITSSQITSVAGSTITGTQTIPRGTLPTGAVLQVVSTTKTDTASGSNLMSADSWASVLSASITPTSSSSKILIMYNIDFGGILTSGDSTVVTRLVRGSTAIAIGDASGSRKRTTTGTGWPAGRSDFHGNQNASFLDSPSTTSSTTYSVQFACRGGGGNTWYCNRSDADADTNETCRAVSTITVMEIAA